MLKRRNDQLRLARMQAICDKQQSEAEDVIKAAYQKAVDAENKDLASELARKLRDKMLANSDKEACLDRLNIDITSISSLLASLAKLSSNTWMVYRQHLRDIPQQEGFPFNIDWGVSPDAEKEERWE